MFFNFLVNDLPQCGVFDFGDLVFQTGHDGLVDWLVMGKLGQITNFKLFYVGIVKLDANPLNFLWHRQRQDYSLFQIRHFWMLKYVSSSPLVSRASNPKQSFIFSKMTRLLQFTQSF